MARNRKGGYFWPNNILILITSLLIRWFFLASVHLQGDAISWFHWVKQSVGELTWQQFSRLACSRFGSRKNIDPCSLLAKLAQTGTVREFITEFEKLSNLVPGLLETHLISLFLSGLRADIRAGV